MKALRCYIVIVENSGELRRLLCTCCRMFETRADVMAMFEQFRSVDKADLDNTLTLLVGRK